MPGTQPSLGTLTRSKTGGALTLTQAIQWAPGRDYTFTITGADMDGDPLSYQTTVTTPSLPLAAPRSWPASIPGPLGTLNAWAVRTYLNEGLNGAEDMQAMLDFLAAASDRTPALTPNTVIDTAESNLNFVDPSTNGPGGVIACPRPFPADALSTSTNGGAARDDNHVVTSAHGSIQITEESDYTFNFRGDDGFMFRIKAASGPHPRFIAAGGPGSVDQAAQNILYFPAGTGDANTRGIIHLTPGTYKLEYATWEGVGGFFYQVSAAKGFFPNNEDTATWAAVGYQTSRTTPVPYPSMVGQWAVDSTPAGVAVGTNANAEASVDAAVAADPVAARSLWDAINFQDDVSGGSERIGGSAIFPRMVNGADDNNFALKAAGTLHIPEDGNYLLGFQGDDGSRLTVGGVHGGFSALVENASGASTIGRANTIAANIGSLGSAVNFAPSTSAQWQQAGAIVGDANKAISTTAVDGAKTRVPFNAGLNPGDSFTVEFWAKPSTIPASLTCVASSGNFANPRSGWLIYMAPAAAAAGGIGWNFRGYTGVGTGFAFSIFAGAEPVAGQWYHVVATWDGSTATIYANAAGGVPATGVTTYVPATTAISSGSLNVGSRADGAFGWSGTIDELAIYPTALDLGTINSHADNGMDPDRLQSYPSLVLERNPLGYWRFNETVQPRADLGSLIYDAALSGNSSTVGRIFLTAGDYPISALFWEAGGGASFEIFATRDIPGGCVPTQALRNGGWPSVPDNNGLALVPHPIPVPAYPTSGLVILPNTAMSITFTSVPYATYTLQCSQDLVNWLDLNNNIAASAASTTFTGVPGDYFFVDPADRRSLYRIIANP